MRAFLPRFGQANIDIMTDIFIDLASRSQAHEVTDDVEAADVILSHRHMLFGLAT